MCHSWDKLVVPELSQFYEEVVGVLSDVLDSYWSACPELMDGDPVLDSPQYMNAIISYIRDHKDIPPLSFKLALLGGSPGLCFFCFF